MNGQVIGRINNGFIFKGELPVAVIIVVVQVIAPVMHCQEVDKSEVMVTLLVFLEVLQQRGYFAQLGKWKRVKHQYRDQYICAYPYHDGKNTRKMIQ